MRNIIVCDIDGTIAKVHPDRLKYIQGEKKDWDAFYGMCGMDEPYTDIIRLISELSLTHEIYFCTGRTEKVRELTYMWINAHYKGKINGLLMRNEGDKRHDTISKPEMLKELDLTQDKVHFILEDRNSMVKKWRELGYRCLQVQEGDF